jgi:hypothetical protein
MTILLLRYEELKGENAGDMTGICGRKTNA